MAYGKIMRMNGDVYCAMAGSFKESQYIDCQHNIDTNEIDENEAESVKISKVGNSGRIIDYL